MLRTRPIERVERLVARFRCAHLLAEPQRVETALDAHDEVVAVGVPHEPAVLDDVVQHPGDLERLDRGTEPDASARPLAVDVGGDEKVGAGEWVVVGHPRAGAGAHLELTRSAPRREPVGEPGEQEQSGPVRVDRVRVETDADPPGQVGGAVAYPPHAAPIRPVVGDVPAHERDAQCEVGRQLVDPPCWIWRACGRRITSRSSTTAVTAQAADIGAPATILARRGCNGSLTIAVPMSVRRPLSSSAPSIVSSSTPWRQVRCGGGSANDSRSGVVPHAASSSARPARSTDMISAGR